MREPAPGFALWLILILLVIVIILILGNVNFD
jgi:hypothetical protein